MTSSVSKSSFGNNFSNQTLVLKNDLGSAFLPRRYLTTGFQNSKVSPNDSFRNIQNNKNNSIIRSLNNKNNKKYYSTNNLSSTPLPSDVDVLIIGGGVTGTALLYELAEFTDLSKVLLIERRSDFATVASGPNNNSQTIHCGDIETNYTVDKAAAVKRVADMLKNFATKLPEDMQKQTTAKMQKMAIGVGKTEVDFIGKRFESFRPLFPKMKLLNKQQIAKIEPWVAYSSSVSERLRSEPLIASYVEDDHSAVDYFHLTKAFVKLAERNNNKKREIRAVTNTEMVHISQEDNGKYKVLTSGGIVRAKFVVVCACGGSLLTAHRLGYGLQYSCLPVAGSFYFTPNILRGKVYTVQNPALPFAAVHGDPDLVAEGKTRFGPTALPLPLLERYNNKTIKDFLEVLKPNMGLAKVYFDLFNDSTIRNYMIKNMMFEIPIVNRRMFLKDARKICPGLQLEDLTYAKGFGGVRPQLVDKKNQKLLLGEGKISPENENIIFNVTPSPGGTTCLGNAEIDMRKILKQIGGHLDENKFKNILLEGMYPVAPL